MRAIYIVLLLFASIASGCYDNHSNPPANESFTERANCTLAQLRTLCKDGNFHVAPDGVCVGRITSSDEKGNFYRTLCIEDESGAAEILLGLHNSHTQYPIGLQVAIRLDGLAVAIEDGVVQIGLAPESYDASLREIASQEMIDRHIIRSTSVTNIEPTTYTLAELDNTLYGRLVRIDNLTHSPLGEEQEHYRFVDEGGNVVFAYVSEYATLQPSLTATSLIGILRLERVAADQDEQFVIVPRFDHDFAVASNID